MIRSMYVVACLAFLCLQGCGNRNAEEQHRPVVDALYAPGADSLPDKQQLALALRADAGIMSDSLRLHVRKKIAVLYLGLGQRKEAINYFLSGAAIARRIRDTASWAVMLNNTGFTYDEALEIDSALKYYTEANVLFHIRNDSLRYGQGLVNLSISNRTLGKYGKAAELGIAAAGVLERLDAPGDLSDAYTAVANALKAVGRMDDALLYHQKALDLRTSVADAAGIAASLNNIGNIFRRRKQYDKALQYYLQALAIKEKAGDPKSIAITTDNVAEVYLEQHQYAKAKQHFTRALALRKIAQDKDGMLVTLHRLCMLSLEMNDLREAERLAKEAMALSPGSQYLKHRVDNAFLLMSVYRKLGKPEQALQYATLCMELKDSLFNEKMMQSVSEMQTRYETNKKSRELVFARELQQEQASQISEKNKYIILLVCLAGALLIVSVRAFDLSRQSKKAKEHVEFLMTELNHRVGNNLQTIIEIYNLQLSITEDAAHREIIEASKKRILAMGIIHKLFDSKGYFRSVDMQQFFQELLKSLSVFHGGNAQNFFLDIHSIRLPVAKAVVAGLIINEIITNIYKHSAARVSGLMIDIALHHAKAGYVLTVEDNCGHWNTETQKRGLGIFIMEQLAAHLAGNMEIARGDEGMIYTINIKK